MITKPALVKGTRDFGPLVMQRRKHILSVIEQVFIRYGFLPLETPAMELLSTLTGKYGDEGDKLLFRILNSGDFAGKTDQAIWNARNSAELASEVAEKGLRYDLTIPLARYVAMNRQEITFPFRRYQMQPVWRADRPQRGRYREFWQCDADVIGSDSLMSEADLISMASEVFKTLEIPVKILINNRKILEGLAEELNISEHFSKFVVLIDKLDKTGIHDLKDEFFSLGLTEADLTEVERLGTQMPLCEDALQSMVQEFGHNEKIMHGAGELRAVMEYCAMNGSLKDVSVDLSLARGLDYYTGCILEIKTEAVVIGSISGGGRYDNLTGVFGLPGVSGVGISFGIDRIYDVMDSLGLFGQLPPTATKALFCHLDEASRSYSYQMASELRSRGYAVEVFPDIKKLPKQFEYAEKKGISLVFITGENEMKSGQISYKDLNSKATGTCDKINLSSMLNS